MQYTSTVMGFSLLSLTRTSYNAFFWVTLQPWEDRKQIEEQFQVIKAKLNLKLLTLPQGTVFAFSPPAISGVGTSGGFQFVLEDRAGKDPEFLVNNLNKFLEAAKKRPEIGMITTTYIPSTPQKFVYVDKEKVLKQGVKLSDVYDTLQAYMGGLFVNYFNDFGRAWQVRVQAEAPYRSNLDYAGQFYVRNAKGEMVPLSALTRFETRYGPEYKMRFNLYSAAQIIGSAAPGYSSEQATAALEEVFHQTMPSEMGFDYMGMSRQEQKAREGIPSSVIFGVSLLFVFLILAALYESWSLAVQRAAEHADRGGRSVRTPVAASYGAGDDLPGLHGADRQRRLLADRARDADRVGGQERNLDRGVCQGATRSLRQAGGGCGVGRCPS